MADEPKRPFDSANPNLSHARAAIGRDLGMQNGGTPPNDLFNGIDEMIEYIRSLERRIEKLEKGPDGGPY